MYGLGTEEWLVVLAFAVFLGYARAKWLPPRVLVIALALWVPFFLVFVAATVPVPVVGDLAAASGPSHWVSAHHGWWEGLLTIYFGFVAGGWLGAKALGIGRADGEP